jgi:hypothetical protein
MAMPEVESVEPTEYTCKLPNTLTVKGKNFTKKVSVKLVDSNGFQWDKEEQDVDLDPSSVPDDNCVVKVTATPSRTDGKPCGQKPTSPDVKTLATGDLTITVTNKSRSPQPEKGEKPFSVHYFS